MQDRPQPPDPDERDLPPDPDITTGDTGDAPEPEPPDDQVSSGVETDSRQVRVTATARRRNSLQLAKAQGELDRTEPIASPSAAVPGEPGRPPVGEPGRSWTWPLISLIGLLVVILVNWLANSWPLNDQTTGEVSRENPVPLQPAGWAFLIWSLIYVLLFAFVIYSFLPAGRRNSRIRAVGPVFLIANIANINWIFFWHWEQFAASLVAIVVLLGCLGVIYVMLRRRGAQAPYASPAQRVLVRVPFSVYFGWVSIATIAALEIWMTNGGWNGGPFGLLGWTVIFLIAGVLVAAAVAFLAKDAVYPLVFVWGYSAIAYEQWDDSSLVSIVAGMLAMVVAAVTVIALLRSFHVRAGTVMPPARHDAKPPLASH